VVPTLHRAVDLSSLSGQVAGGDQRRLAVGLTTLSHGKLVEA
jgi:hypothetical protein